MDNEVKDADEIDYEEKHKCCEDKRNNRKLNLIATGVAILLYFVAIIAFLLIGFFTDIWHPTWLVFLAPIFISSIITAIGYKNANYFNYPILVVGSYILFGTLFDIWHPLWVLFITIPLYYMTIDFITKICK